MLPGIQTKVNYTIFALPGIQTYINYNIFPLPGIQTYVNCCRFGFPGIQTYVEYRRFGLPDIQTYRRLWEPARSKTEDVYRNMSLNHSETLTFSKKDAKPQRQAKLQSATDPLMQLGSKILRAAPPSGATITGDPAEQPSGAAKRSSPAKQPSGAAQ